MMWKFILLLFGNYMLQCYGQLESSREFDAYLNPGCPDDLCNSGTNDNAITLIHILAKSQSDWLHYIWDFTGKPSILLALTPPDTNLIINWDSMMNDEPNTVTFTRKPKYTAMAVINKLWQFNDSKDIGLFPAVWINASEVNEYDTQYFTWRRQMFHKSLHNVAVTVVGDNTDTLGNGTIKLKFKCFSIRDHDIDLPHLFMTENSTLVDFILDNLKINENFRSARFAAEIIMITDETINSNSSNQSFTVLNRKSLDDEHTPGIFHLVEIASPASYLMREGSYMQYRPVSYTHPERDVSTSTELHNGQPSNLDDPKTQLNSSLALSYYGSQLDNILVQGFNVSFGQSGDGFYTKSKYNTWTFVMAYGAPPTEQLSMFVIIVASIGLGLPLLLLFAGGCFICIKRARNR